MPSLFYGRGDFSENRLILANSGSQTEPLCYCESHFGGLKIANCRFEAIRAKSLARYGNRGFSANRFARVYSRESPRFSLRIAGPSKYRDSNSDAILLGEKKTAKRNG